MPSKRPLQVALISLGCPKNLVDSERILALLAEGGCIVAAPMDEADVIVINTCGFIAPAIEESLEVINEALEHKRTGIASRVVVSGCLVNRFGTKLYESASGIDAIVGVNNRDQILAAVTGKGRFSRNDPYREGTAAVGDASRFRLTPRHTAYLRISEGCSQKCTFCTIPVLRGPFRSKPPGDVLAEARELIADGCGELNVIGQDTTSYGLDLPADNGAAGHRRSSVGCADVGGLLRKLGQLEGVRWVRLMYAYPNRLTETLIDAIAESPRIVHYIDLPLQHICDPILRRMGRGVSQKGIEKLLQRLRSRIPDVVIRTTFIVGFPGETDGHFTELLEFVKGFGFDAVGVFEFSPEQGTAAAKMTNQVPDELKAARAETLMLAQQEIVFAANRRMVGREVEILVDGTDRSGRCFGRHYGQAPEIDSLCYLTKDRPAGTFVKGKVVNWDRYDLVVQIDDPSPRG